MRGIFALLGIPIGFLTALAPAAESPPGQAVKADVEALVKGNNAFALRLFGQLGARPGNLFLSPYSISQTLAMVQAGARGQTADEIARAMRFPADQEELHPAFAALVRRVLKPARADDYQLTNATALWAPKEVRFLPAFTGTLKGHYGAAPQTVDFGSDPEGARQTINQWAEKQTRGKIKNLLGRKDVGRDTQLVVTSAIYFKAAWEKPFNKSATKPADFLAHGKTKTPVPFMYAAGEYGYQEGEFGKALELPYAGKELSMVVLLPKEGEGLKELQQTLRAEQLGRIFAGLKPQLVAVALPKFQFSAEQRLKDELSSLGMARAFTGGADFSGMTGSKGIQLSNVIHQAYVDVHEEGTEAAAATAAVGVRSAPAVKPKSFRADRPFVFLVRHRPTNSILFLGQLTEPKPGKL